MTIKDIEIKLRRYRGNKRIPYELLATHGLLYPTIKRIEIGENYAVSSLIKYIAALSLALYANNQPVNDEQSLGYILYCKRKESHSLVTLGDYTGLRPSRIIAIEKGRGCQRKNLLKYLDIVPIMFDLKTSNHEEIAD